MGYEPIGYKNHSGYIKQAMGWMIKMRGVYNHFTGAMFKWEPVKCLWRTLECMENMF